MTSVRPGGNPPGGAKVTLSVASAFSPPSVAMTLVCPGARLMTVLPVATAATLGSVTFQLRTPSRSVSNDAIAAA